MDWKHDVVELNGVDTSRESLEILELNVADPVEGRIENRVERVAEQVEGNEVEVQSDNWLSLKVDPNLRIEWNRPSYKVNPANDKRDEDDRRRVRNDNANEKLRIIHNAWGRWVADNFDMSGAFSKKADNLLPVLIWIRGNLELSRGNRDHFVVILIQVHSQFSGNWSAKKSCWW